MPHATEPTPAEQLADLLDGRLQDADVPPELVELAELASAVRTHITLVPPTDAFRETLRDQVVQAATAPAATPAVGPATSAATTTTVTGAGGGLAAVVAGVSAAAVLAASTVAVADRAGPGDLLSGVDRGMESLQLLVADDTRDVDLLVGFATERVLEGLDVVDVAVVEGLLDEADRLVADAVALAVAQGRSVEELLAPYTGALLTLSSRTDLPAVEAAVARRLEALGVDPTTPPPPADDGRAGSPSREDGPSEGPDEERGQGDGDGDPLDDVTDPLDDVTDPLDDVTDPVDDVTDPVDDVTDPLDDVTDPLDDVTDPLDDVTDPLDDVTVPLDEATDLLDP